ncbi:homoserine kinase [Neoconidiobolus thromboides FSU 785]|nr:homoserine kinase [Neoconidiobolus thromboides FSU 785]
MSLNFTLKIPASSANLGPGFDTLGLGLKLYLTIKGEFIKEEGADEVEFSFEGDGKELMSKDRKENLITKSMYCLLEKYGKSIINGRLKLHIKNSVPLGRGLGSSASAVVGGVMLGNEVSGLNLKESEILNVILDIETHPDNVIPCFKGGLITSYVDQKAENKVGYVKLPLNKNIRAILIVPDYPLETSKARKALPESYTREQVVFNLQRLTVLCSSLCQEELNADLIYNSMKDKIHQPYRQHLIPGLEECLKTLTPSSLPGLLGICLSGAGPTVLALASDNLDTIGNTIKKILDKEGKCDCKVMPLQVEPKGVEVIYN